MPVLLMTPHLSPRPWGGRELESFGYTLPEDTPIGEAWAIAAHPNGVSTVCRATGRAGDLVGLGLDELWENHRDLFGDFPGERFPLLTKIIDAQDWLSLQLHPSDEEAPEGDLGKAECWYVIGSKEGAQLVHGIKETNLARAKERIEAGTFEDFFVYHDAKVGDFFDVPTGLVHGIGPGIMILETQQNSDTTYRLYDWDRPGLDGQLRPLHLAESAACVRTDLPDGVTTPTTTSWADLDRHFYVTNDYFSVEVWDVHTDEVTVDRPHPQMVLISVVDGEVTIDDGDGPLGLVKGDHVVVGAHAAPLSLFGHGQLVVSWPA